MESERRSPKIARRGLMLVLSSPSGAGKTTLARALLASDDNIRLSVSVTTRKARPGEVEGKDYFFVDDKRFAEMRDKGKLLEWARVFDNFYGTPREAVEKAISAGQDVLFDIDWQGTQQLAEKMQHDLVRVFILPPSGKDTGIPFQDARAGSARSRRQAHGGSLAPKSAIGRSTTTSSSTRISMRASRD